MRKLTLSFLAASIALVPAAALAEQQRGGGGNHGGGQWRGGGGHGGGQWHGGGGHRGGNRGGGFVGGGFFGGGFWGGGGGGGQTVVVIGGQVGHPGADYRHRRLRRGAYVHPYWYGDQFHIGDWRGYGFRDPGRDRRWIRYYDDAYLVDRGGRVVDRREDYDWERHDEEWEMEEGIPAYRGRHRRQRDEDHEWAERDRGEGHAEGWDYDEYGHGGTVVHGGPAYGHGGYGYGYAYPIIVETTVTTGQSYVEEVVEEYVTVQRPRRRARPCNCARPRAPAPRPRPAPRPPAGERG